MADGCTEIVFSTNGAFKEYYNYSGYLLPQHTNHRTLTMGKCLGLFGIRLYPYALEPLLRVASTELVNNVHSLNPLIHQDLIDQISEAADTKERVEKASQYLTRKLMMYKTSSIENVIHRLIETEGQASITELQNITGLSERQFERKFKSVIGFTPKHYSRIIRFQHTKKKFIARPRTTFADLAYQSNYADQSHFIREFKEFSGMSVTDYFNLVNRPESEEARLIKKLLLAKDEVYRQPELATRA
jgi:AraC-like DNA-binding protein